MIMPFLLDSEALIAGAFAAVLVLGLAILLLRSSQRCPKDKTALRLVAPESGHHMIFRCPKCGFHKRTKVPLGRR